MRRIQISALVAAVAIVGVALPAAAQSGQVSRSATYAAAPSVKRDSVAFARAQQVSERADRRWHSYDLAGARRDYTQAVEILRSRQLYAGPTLVSLAHVTYVTESPLRAARVLIDAAEEAAAFGDLALQAQSLFEASLLYEQGGDEGQARRLLEQTRRLLQSPYLPAEVKERIARRMITEG
jgi:hypothetical protein